MVDSPPTGGNLKVPPLVISARSTTLSTKQVFKVFSMFFTAKHGLFYLISLNMHYANNEYGETMIIEDKVTLKRKVKKSKYGYEYATYYVSFSIKYTPILQHHKELQNVIIITDDGKSKITLPKVRLYVYTHYYNRKTGKKIKQFSFTIPLVIGEELWNKGQRKLKVLVEVPDAVVVKN